MSTSTPVRVFLPALAALVWACGGRDVLDLGGDAGTSSTSSSGGSTSGSGSGSSSGGSGSDDGSSDVAFTQQYVMACQWQIVPQAVYATYFVATARYTPASGGGGTLDFTEQALVMGATTITQVAGSPTTVNGSPVLPQSQVTDAAPIADRLVTKVSFGSLVIPAAADALQQGPINLEGAVLTLAIGPGDQICGGWTAEMTDPLVTSLQPASQNPCVLIPTTGSVVPVTQAQLTCP